MSTAIIVSLVMYLCPDLERVGYYLQQEEVSCMDYYTNDIINNPKKYESLVLEVRSNLKK